MDIVLPATFAYFFIVFLMRVVGRRELSSFAPTDIVLLVVIGDRSDCVTPFRIRSVEGITLAISTFDVLTAA
jgi:uncharacterized membrane protein YcaP (DUF421 family)